VVPYDYVEFARTMRRYVAPIEHEVATRGWSVPTQALRDAIDRMEHAASSFAAARDAALARDPAPAQLRTSNAALMEVERALTRPTGLRTRPWYRNLIYVADENNGYANMPLPSINEAIRARDAALVASETTDLARRFDAATAALERARAAFTEP
jgi:N-acetylated-alpha-linked acidic dipeptidase